MRLVARAPNHLGDGVMALPALHALARLGDLTIVAPPWGPVLYRDVPAQVIPRGDAPRADVAILFPPSWRAAWQTRRSPRRIGVSGDFGRRLWLTDVVPERTHRGATYADLARKAGAVVVGPPEWRSRPDDPTVDVPEGHIGLNPISISGAPVQWQGFGELARRLTSPVVWYGGPGEEAAVAACATVGDRRVGLSLPALANALSRCRWFVSNDSGAAHFARACGVPTLVVYGATEAAQTGPSGAEAIHGPDVPCRPCYRKECAPARGVARLACLQVDVARVLAILA